MQKEQLERFNKYLNEFLEHLLEPGKNGLVELIFAGLRFGYIAIESIPEFKEHLSIEFEKIVDTTPAELDLDKIMIVNNGEYCVAHLNEFKINDKAPKTVINLDNLTDALGDLSRI
jgi:hypothetical protein